MKTLKMALSFVLFAAAAGPLNAQEAARPDPTPGDANLERLDACGLDLLACVQGAFRAGTPLRIGGCRRAYNACRQAPRAQASAPVVECRQKCMKTWNRCRRDATPGFLEAQRACIDRARACGAGNRACWQQAVTCPNSRKDLDACIDARQQCEDFCVAVADVFEAEK